MIEVFMIGCYYGNYFLIWGLFNKILFPNGNAYFVMDHSAYLDSESGNSNVSMYLGERNHIYRISANSFRPLIVSAVKTSQ